MHQKHKIEKLFFIDSRAENESAGRTSEPNLACSGKPCVTLLMFVLGFFFFLIELIRYFFLY